MIYHNSRFNNFVLPLFVFNREKAALSVAVAVKQTNKGKDEKSKH